MQKSSVFKKVKARPYGTQAAVVRKKNQTVVRLTQTAPLMRKIMQPYGTQLVAQHLGVSYDTSLDPDNSSKIIL